jgi:hypothetical protein
MWNPFEKFLKPANYQPAESPADTNQQPEDAVESVEGTPGRPFAETAEEESRLAEERRQAAVRNMREREKGKDQAA